MIYLKNLSLSISLLKLYTLYTAILFFSLSIYLKSFLKSVSLGKVTFTCNIFFLIQHYCSSTNINLLV
jgi:hypothetical protein